MNFSFLRIKVDEHFRGKDVGDKNNYVTGNFDLRLASTNTRPEGFKNPVVVDNKKILIKYRFYQYPHPPVTIHQVTTEFSLTMPILFSLGVGGRGGGWVNMIHDRGIGAQWDGSGSLRAG